MAMPSQKKDLHPFFDPSISTIEFRVLSKGRMVRVDVPKETLSRRFGVRETPHGLLTTYEAHREEIDAAVIRRAADDGPDVVVIRPTDLDTKSSHGKRHREGN
jgi:hypothetical protein